MLQGMYDIMNFLLNQKDFKFSQCIEIGSFRGDSTKIWAEYFDHVHAIDPWLPETTEFIQDGTCEEVEAAFDTIVTTYPNIYKHKQRSKEASEEFPNLSADFIYIDGDHSKEACKWDILNWGKRLPRHGYLGIHDVNVKQGVNEALREIWPTLPPGGSLTFFCDTSLLIPAKLVHDVIYGVVYE